MYLLKGIFNLQKMKYITVTLFAWQRLRILSEITPPLQETALTISDSTILEYLSIPDVSFEFLRMNQNVLCLK